MKYIIILLFLVLSGQSIAIAETYYIDWDTGSDNNIGISKIVPWKRVPGMKGFSGSYTHVSGDVFIFKGGVTWPNSALPLTIAYSGIPADDDIYTIDLSWYSGDSWTRPIFNGDDTTQKLIVSTGKSYYKLDNIELSNARSNFTDTVGNDPIGIEIIGGGNITLQNLYLHDINNNTIPPCKNYGGFAIYILNSYNLEIFNNDIGGAEFGIMYTSGTPNFSANIKIHHNTVRNTGGGIAVALNDSGADMDKVEIYNNDIGNFGNWWNCGNSPYHIDLIHVWGRSGSTTDQITNLEIYNNYFHDIDNAYVSNSTAQVFIEYSIIDPLIYNNIFYNSKHENMILVKTAVAGQYLGPKIYNNIFDSPALVESNNNYIIDYRDADGVEIKNNIFMNSKESAIRFDAGGKKPKSDNNIFFNMKNIGRVGNSYYTTLTDWQAYLGNCILDGDCKSSTVNPNLSIEFRPTSESPLFVKEGGVSLSSYFTFDKSNYTRQSKWSLGAYQWKQPTPPLNLYIK